MDQIYVKARKWGNSFGIVLPKSIVDKENIDEGTELVISIKTKRFSTVGELMALSKKMGIAKRLKDLDTKKALKEVDEYFWKE